MLPQSSCLMPLVLSVSGRNSIRTGSRIYNRTNDATPLTHTHTRLVNVAVVERRNRDPGDGTDSATFEVQEATVVPKKAGMSILMFDLCCSKGRRTRPKKPRARSGMREDPSPEQVGAAWEAPSRVKVWDPTIDYHLSSVQRARQSSSDVQLRLLRSNSEESHEAGSSHSLPFQRSDGWT
uniref:Uncharacterized protein n=1 Tax=Guillardia theta TaxID=55529 RepID=A0A6U6BBE9_GUITH|mmetsp:Transcript_37174/g.116987  ORF Transcript_37174/g.116987 Transcript_37174/m.116987 type:complete len:180 (+) Transcript_37174:736-1275(+)